MTIRTQPMSDQKNKSTFTLNSAQIVCIRMQISCNSMGLATLPKPIKNNLSIGVI